jgi:Protein of unknown function (DUF2490)
MSIKIKPMRNIFFIIICCVAFGVQTFAYKPVYPDFGIWNTLNVTYKLNNKWGLLFTQEWRLRENASRLNLFYTNIGANYNLGKGLKTALIYRHIDKYLETNNFSFRHRLMWDMSYKKDIEQWNFSLRHRLQIEWTDIYSSEFGFYPQLFSRVKGEVGYTIGKFTPNISTEFRAQWTDARNNGDDDNISRNRTIFGLDYDLNKAIKLGTYYLYQAEFNTVTPQIINIVGLECNINLNKLLPSSKKPKKQKS